MRHIPASGHRLLRVLTTSVRAALVQTWKLLCRHRRYAPSRLWKTLSAGLSCSTTTRHELAKHNDGDQDQVQQGGESKGERHLKTRQRRLGGA